MISWRALCLVFLAAILTGCSKQPESQGPTPQSVLQAIPAPDSAKYDSIRDMKNWRNPYLIVRADGVALFDVADSAEIVLKPNDLLPELAKLPPSNWPYGRVVAATESTRGSEQDAVAIRKNKGILGGLLQGAHIDVKWVPAT